jgi:hypothetical protein
MNAIRRNNKLSDQDKADLCYARENLTEIIGTKNVARLASLSDIFARLGAPKIIEKLMTELANDDASELPWSDSFMSAKKEFLWMIELVCRTKTGDGILGLGD